VPPAQSRASCVRARVRYILNMCSSGTGRRLRRISSSTASHSMKPRRYSEIPSRSTALTSGTPQKKLGFSGSDARCLAAS